MISGCKNQPRKTTFPANPPGRSGQVASKDFCPSSVARLLDTTWRSLRLNAVRHAVSLSSMNSNRSGKPHSRLFVYSLTSVALVSLLLGLGVLATPVWPDDNQLPHLVTPDGRHALIVDGAPFLTKSIGDLISVPQIVRVSLGTF